MARQHGSVILGAGAVAVLGFAAAAVIGGNLKLTGRAAGSSQPAPPYRAPSGITGVAGTIGGGAASTGGAATSGGGPSAPASTAPPPSGTSVGSTQPGGLARPL